MTLFRQLFRIKLRSASQPPLRSLPCIPKLRPYISWHGRQNSFLSSPTKSPRRSYQSTQTPTPTTLNSDHTVFEQLGGGEGYASKGISEGQGDKDQNDESAADDEERFKEDLLELALIHVTTLGWSTEAISRAAVQAGLSPAVASMFKDSDLVHYFISRSNRQLEHHLSSQNKDTTPLTLYQALEWRLQKVVPFGPTYSEAIAIISRPEHIQKSIGLLMDIADSIAHYVLKDSSTDLNWYSKRMGIATIFVTTELTLVQDQSNDYLETWKFLERRCQEFDKYGKGELNLLSVPLPELLHIGFSTFLNLVGRNAPR